MKPVFYAFLVTLGMSGCGYSPVKYSASQMPSDSVTKELERLLWETWTKFQPEQVEVTREYFRTANVHTVARKGPFRKGEALAAVNSASTVYYRSIGETTIYNKGKVWQVVITGRSDEPIYRYYTLEEKNAKEFADAVDTLRRGAVIGTSVSSR